MVTDRIVENNVPPGVELSDSCLSLETGAATNDGAANPSETGQQIGQETPNPTRDFLQGLSLPVYVDDLKDDPGYAEYRARHGPDAEFEYYRQMWKARGCEVWQHQDFRMMSELGLEEFVANDTPTIALIKLRNAVEKLEIRGINANPFTANVIPINEFLARDFSVKYLVEDVLPAGQLCIVGGPEKGQKSNLLVDLAISLAAGKPWLGHFEVTHAVRVLYLTGETQGANLKNIITRIMGDRGVSVGDLDDRLSIKEELPTLDDTAQRNTLDQILRREKIEVVILDPLYFALGAVDAHLLTQVGGTIATVSKLCGSAGTTLILAHHMSKTAQMRRGEEREPMQLADLNGAGFGPVAGCWILINYLVPYDPITGSCVLNLNVGGRAGHGGYYSVRINEGKFVKDLPLNGRIWQPEVKSGQRAIELAQEVMQAERSAKADAKKKAKATNDDALADQVAAWLWERGSVGAIQAEIANHFKIPPKALGGMLGVMEIAGRIFRAPRAPSDNPNARRWRAKPLPTR